MKYLTLFALASVIAFDVSASDSGEDDPSAVVLPVKQATGLYIEQPIQNIPAAISIIDKEQIQQAAEQLSLAEALRKTPGVFVANPYNFAQDSRISIRGFGARSDFGVRGIKLYVDGIPATTPDGQGEVDGLDLGSAERIEVIRGPSSALYGAASGGAILIDSEVGSTPTSVENRWTFGDFGLLNSQLKFSARGEQFASFLNLNALRYDGYRDNSETEQYKANAKVSVELTSKQRLKLIANFIEMPTQDDPGGLTALQAREDPEQASARNLLFDAGESVAQQKLGVVYSAELSSSQIMDLSFYGIQRNFENRLPFESGGQVSLDRSVAGTSLRYKHELDRFVYVVGTNYDFQDDDRRNYDNLAGQRGNLVLSQNEQVQSFGAFVVATFELHPALSLSGALRYDTVDFDVLDKFEFDGDDSGKVRYNETSPMLGINWSASDDVVVYANVATSFETPTTTELDNPTGGGFNRGLDPQTAISTEIGIKSRREFLNKVTYLDLSLFHIEIDDSLVGFELASAPDRTFFRNAGSEERVGFEASLEVELSEELSAYLSYTWSDFTYETYATDSGDFSGNQIPGIPQQFADFGLQYKMQNGFFVRTYTRAVGDFYADDANTTNVSGYSVTDLRLGSKFAFGKWELSPFLGISNLFDQDYNSNVRINAFSGRYFEPAPGRNLYAGFNLQFAFD